MRILLCILLIFFEWNIISLSAKTYPDTVTSTHQTCLGIKYPVDKVVDFGDRCVPIILYDSIKIVKTTPGASQPDPHIIVDDPFFKLYVSYITKGGRRIERDDTIYEPIYEGDTIVFTVRCAPEMPGKYFFAADLFYALERKYITEAIWKEYTIYYEINAKADTDVRPEADTLDFGDIPVMKAYYKDLEWISEDIDTLNEYSCDVYASLKDVTWKSNPFIVSKYKPDIMQFKVTAQDTGTKYLKYTFFFNECIKMRSVIIKYNGISSVLAVKNKIEAMAKCSRDTVIQIVLNNAGKMPLLITDVKLREATAPCDILKFASEQLYPVKIEPQSSDTLSIRFFSDINDTINANIQIYHDDTLRLTSPHNPSNININVIFASPVLVPALTVVDFGDVCVGRGKLKYVTIKNTGNLTASIPKVAFKLKEYNMVLCPDSITAGSSGSYSMVFIPSVMDDFIDTFEVATSPCKDKYRIVVKGRGVSNDVTVLPENINSRQAISTAKSYSIEVKSLSLQKITIDTAYITPILPEISIAFITKFPLTLHPDNTVRINFTALSNVEATYAGELKIPLSSQCLDTYNLPVYIEFMDKQVLLFNEISYLDNAGEIITHISKTAMCDSSIIYDTIWVHNTEAYTFKALNFEMNTPNYAIYNDLQLPKNVAKNGREQVIIAFTPTGEGIYENKLIFEMQDEGTDEPYFDTIPVTHTFRKAATNISSNKIDFGLTNICADTMTQKIVFTNTGSLQDTAIIDTYDMPSYYKVSQDTVIVPANGSSEVTLYFIPGNASHTGKSIYNLHISTIICHKQLQLFIEHELDNIALTATDADFGTLYLSASKTMDIEVINTSKHDILLTEINLLPDMDNYIFDIALPTTIPANQSISIPVVFTADSVGNYIVDMVFTGENDCKVTAISKLTAKVLEHIYPIMIWFDTTKAAPGDMVSLSGYIEHVSPELKADSIDMIIDIDKSLFDLRNMYLHYGNPPVWQELSYENLQGNSIKASIGADVADMALHADGRFLELYGQVLLSSPRSTTISYNVFDIFTSQNHTLVKRDGLLELSGYCFPDLRDIEFTPSFSYNINEVIVNQNSMDIRFVATDNMHVVLYMTNILGEKVYADNLQLNKGDNAYTINLNNINSGIYNIRLKSKYYNNISKNIMIMR